MARFITEPPTEQSAASTTAGAPAKTKHIIAIRGPVQQGRYLVGAIKAYTEGAPQATADVNAAPKRTVEVIEQPTVNRIEVSDLSADLTLVLVKEDCEVVGASVIYNIDIPTTS